MKEETDLGLYTSAEVAVILDMQQQTVSLYHRRNNIGRKIGRDLFFTDADIEEIRVTDGRRK